MFWFYVLPLGFLLTQYTITGFDACAHISEETHGAADAAAEGRLAVDLLLGDLRLDRAAGDHVRRRRRRRPSTRGGRRPVVSIAIFESAMGTGWVKVGPDHLDRRPAVLRRGLPDQRVAHVYAFSRDGAIPGLADLEQGQPQARPVQRGARSWRSAR